MWKKCIINTNIDKIGKMKIIKNLETWINTWYQNLLSSLTNSNKSKNTEKCNKYSRTSMKVEKLAWKLKKETRGGYTVDVNR